MTIPRLRYTAKTATIPIGGSGSMPPIRHVSGNGPGFLRRQTATTGGA